MSTPNSPIPFNRRNTYVLSLCQGLFTCAISIDLTLTGLTGYQLAPNKAWATLPFALITVTGALVTLFASLLLGRLGRKWGFSIGALACVLGGLVSVWSVIHHNFIGFCFGTAAIGIFQAFAQFYRLAAADAVAPHQKSRAISAVLAGGVIAAILGPVIAAWSKDLIPATLFAGSYLMVSIFGLATIGLLVFFYKDQEFTDPADYDESTPPRHLSKIIKQPIFMVATVNNVVAWIVMMFIMTAAPLAAVAHHHTIDDGARIIEWHLIGMYAPALFSGYLIEKMGVGRVLIMGMILNLLCGVIAIASTDLAAFHLALLFLGIGWNFIFVGGTALLTRSYRSNERVKTQGLAELLRSLLR